MTICRLCRQEKPADAFYRSDPRSCKECIKAATKINRLQRIDHYRAYDQARASRPDRVAARAAYIKTDAGKSAHQRATQKYVEANAHRRAAQVAVGNAIRDGRLTPWPVCAVPTCDQPDPQAHHPDYSQPLDVVWLCDTHHKEAHALAKKAA